MTIIGRAVLGSPENLLELFPPKQQLLPHDMLCDPRLVICNFNIDTFKGCAKLGNYSMVTQHRPDDCVLPLEKRILASHPKNRSLGDVLRVSVPAEHQR